MMRQLGWISVWISLVGIGMISPLMAKEPKVLTIGIDGLRADALMAAVQQRDASADEDWLSLVSTDHGGEGIGHGGGRENPNVFQAPMIVSGSAAERADTVQRDTQSPPPATVDLVPLALTHLGIPIDGKWQLAGRVGGWLKASQVE